MGNKKLKTLYLHIGLEKTGTTSIQDSLHTNQVKLAENGVFVPRSLGYKNHKEIAAYGFDTGSQDIAVRSLGVGHTQEAVDKYRANLESRLADDIFASKAEIGIISSEDLSRLFTPSEVNRVIGMLRNFCDDLKVVVFIRRQDLLAASRYFTLVVEGSRQNWILPEAGSPQIDFYDFSRHLEHWIDAVGVKNLEIVRFPERPKMEKFDSVQAFLNITGVKASGLRAVSHQHISLDAVNQIITQTYNTLRNDYVAKDVSDLIKILRPFNNPQCRHILGKKQAQDFADLFGPSNENLFKRTGRSDIRFSRDFSMYPDENMRLEYQSMAMQRLLKMRFPELTG